MVVDDNGSLRLFRNPGGELRGIIYVESGPDPTVRVDSFPTVKVEYDEIDQVYVAACDCFDVVGTGKSELKALEALEAMLRVYLSEILRHGNLFQELDARGWVEVSTSEARGLLSELREASRADLERYAPQITLADVPQGLMGVA